MESTMPLAIGNVPGMKVKPGSMRRPLPGVPIVPVDPVTGQSADEGEIRVDLRGREEQASTGEIAVTEWRDDQFPELRG